MSYLIDDMARALKAARKREGISQRELSSRSGVPQSHISKIENGAVDLRVSSLIGIARELGLELTLIPRKTVPAVNSIVRSSERQIENPLTIQSKKIKNNLQKIDQIIGAKSKDFDLNLKTAEKLQQQLREMQKFRIDSVSFDGIEQIRNAVERIEDATSLKIAATKIDSLRNALAHKYIKPVEYKYPRPAYSLEEDDNV